MVLAALPPPAMAKPEGGREEYVWNFNNAAMYRSLADAQYNLAAYAEAEKSIRKALAYDALLERSLDRRRDEAKDRALLAMSLARQGRAAEASEAIAPALQFHRELASLS